MPAANSPSNRCSHPDHTDTMSDNTGEASPESPSKRRKVFLQTMGQQLRDAGSMWNTSGSSGDTNNAVSFPRPGNASGIYFIRSVYGGLAADRASRRQLQIQHETPESDVAPGEDDQLPAGATKSASKYLWQPSEVLAIPVSDGDGSDIFSFDDLLDWTRSYFDNWHPAYPFLHAPSVLEFFDHVARKGASESDETTTYQLTILRSIMSISLADRRQTGTPTRPIPTNLLFNSFNHAISSIQRVLTDENTIQSLQAVVSVQLFLLSMLRYNAASHLEGLAVRMAFRLGLHRCPMQPPDFPGKEAELRQRLFWSIYCIDRYICVRLGLPLAIRDDDIDACYPGAEQHVEGDHDHPGRDNRLNLLDFLARHAEIRGSIMELRKKSVSHGQTETDQTVIINTELTKWGNEVDEYLESNDSQSLPISRFHQVTLVVLRYESTIALNRSILATSKKSSAYNAALQNCISASRSVINTLHKGLKILGNNLEESPAPEVPDNTALLWPSFTWAVWMSAFIMIYAANEDQVPQEVAIRLADRSLEILKHLTLRGSVWPDACAVAIRDLRAQLIERGNRSRNTNGQRKKGSQNEEVRRTPQRSMPQQDGTGNDDLGSPLSNPTRLQQSQHTATSTSSFRTNHRMPQERQDSANTSMNPPEYPDPSLSHVIDSLNNGSGSNHSGASNLFSGPTRQNMLFSDLSNFADPQQWNIRGIGQQVSWGIPMPSDEGTDLLYGSEIPFWMGDDQWQGLGGTNWA